MSACIKKQRIAIVTGGNRGLGFEICKQLAAKDIHVILTARDTTQGYKAVDKLRDDGAKASFYPLDITDKKSIIHLAEHVHSKIGLTDILVNNAGIYLDQGVPALDTTPEMIVKAISTDLCGAFTLCQAVLPAMREQKYGRIVNISSRTSRLDQMDNTGLSYKITKSSLNVITVVLSKELEGENILINAVNPGWVKTTMGGKHASLGIAEGAQGAVWLATLPDNSPSGCFFNGCIQAPW